MNITNHISSSLDARRETSMLDTMFQKRGHMENKRAKSLTIYNWVCCHSMAHHLRPQKLNTLPSHWRSDLPCVCLLCHSHWTPEFLSDLMYNRSFEIPRHHESIRVNNDCHRSVHVSRIHRIYIYMCWIVWLEPQGAFIQRFGNREWKLTYICTFWRNFEVGAVNRQVHFICTVLLNSP